MLVLTMLKNAGTMLKNAGIDDAEKCCYDAEEYQYDAEECQYEASWYEGVARAWCQHMPRGRILQHTPEIPALTETS